MPAANSNYLLNFDFHPNTSFSINEQFLTF